LLHSFFAIISFDFEVKYDLYVHESFRDIHLFLILQIIIYRDIFIYSTVPT